MHKNKVFIVWIFPYFFLCILSELYSWQVLLYVQVYLTWISFNFISTFYIDIFIAGICIIETGEVWGKDIITVYIFSSEIRKKHCLYFMYVFISTMKEWVSVRTASLKHERVLNLWRQNKSINCSRNIPRQRFIQIFSVK